MDDFIQGTAQAAAALLVFCLALLLVTSAALGTVAAVTWLYGAVVA